MASETTGESAQSQSELASITLTALKFADESAISLLPDDIVVVVGPNNSGKSATLRAIYAHLSGRDANENLRVLTAIEFQKIGDREQLIALISKDLGLPDNLPELPKRGARGARGTFHLHHVTQRWTLSDGIDGGIVFLFCEHLQLDSRLNGSDPVDSFDTMNESPGEALQYLLRDVQLERKISQYFKRAFGSDLLLNPVGSKLSLHCGDGHVREEFSDRAAPEYQKALKALAPVEKQGDGIRAFATVVLNSLANTRSVTLIDEPEAFLHPPQARTLGYMLAREFPKRRQAVIATHSGDVVRGLLEGDAGRIKILRLNRPETGPSRVLLLSNEEIQKVWRDPILYHSNILDGLFHERVIVCEADTDCRFYSAMLQAISEAQADARRPDFLFVHSGGKDRMPTVVNALRKVGVPVTVIADFDLLRSGGLLKQIVEYLGGSWASVQREADIVRSAIDERRPTHRSTDIKTQIETALKEVTEEVFPDRATTSIKNILKTASAWSIAKGSGRSFVPSGDATTAYGLLDQRLREFGLFVVPVGEVEMFYRPIGGHGTTWLNQVIQKPLKDDPDLDEAREFVRALAGITT
jgi:AAA domain, putative AbiEii toxin, Type IV TA system/Overcoming lysogenization defect protein-like, TOPRIM domain